MLQADTGLPTIVVYDGYQGGAGIAELGYQAADRHLAATLEAIEDVHRPTAAHPACSLPSAATSTTPLDKAGALASAGGILGSGG